MSKLKSTKGFTLIELVIVLAIAALVLAAILLAVGGAQRSQRDTTTKNSASRVGQALQNYASNNNGAMPPSGASVSSIGSSYFTNILDGNGNAPSPAASGASATGTNPAIIFSGNAKCSGTSGTSGTVTYGTVANPLPRNYAVDYYVENGSTNVCIDNT